MGEDLEIKNTSSSERKIRTTIEVVLVAAVIGILIYFFRFTQENDCITVPCEDPENLDCYKSILEVENFIDPAIDPCDDFHQFLCGSFLKSATKTGITSQRLHQETQIHNELYSFIIDPIAPTDSQHTKFQKQFFQSCINEDLHHKNVVRKLLDEIHAWPSSQEHEMEEDTFDWINAMIKCKELGLPFQWFLKFRIHQEDKNYLMISYPKQDFTEMRISQFYTNPASKRLVQNLIAFGRELNQIIDISSSSTGIKTVGQLQNDCPKLNWLDLLNNITEPIIQLSEETEIASNIEMYIIKLHNLLSKTPKIIQANYIEQKIVDYLGPFMNDDDIGAYPEARGQSRIQLCIEATKANFPQWSEIEYVKKYYSSETKEAAVELVESIRLEFLHRLELFEWWNTTFGHNYIQRFTQTTINIEDPRDISDDVDLNSTPNLIDLITDRSKRNFESFLRRINRTGTDSTNFGVNIVYDSLQNRMMVPWSLLHGFFFDHNRPNFLNYASFGTVVAQKFVENVRMLSQIDSDFTYAAFEASNKCFEADYVTMTMKRAFEKAFSAIQSEVISEIVPEIVGRDIAYVAYQKWLKSNEEESHQPFSANQLFWIKSSLINCRTNPVDVKAETDLELILTKYKIVMSVKHSIRFARDFSCPPNSPMNPTKKC